MSGARSEPPELEDFRYMHWLGGGGFADVFLYQQRRPSRPVAIKVLRASAEDNDLRRRFEAEADLMAQVSTHPHIVSIITAQIASDGRPYLVMEYYPKPHYGVLSRPAGMRVEQVLRVGVQIAGAVEAAHQVGILHRDIKPANILSSEYDRPGLADFGIAGARGSEGFEDIAGLSIPYAPPEIIKGSDQGSERSDVYSLAASVYTMLAGRAPFERSGGQPSTEQEMIARILNDPVPATGRQDVPPSLEHLLRQALAKDPSGRPPSAVSLARGLQDIEAELRLAVTSFESRVDDVAPVRNRTDEHESTRAALPRVVRPADHSPVRTPAPTDDRTVRRPAVAEVQAVPAIPLVAATVLQPTPTMLTTEVAVNEGRVDTTLRRLPTPAAAESPSPSRRSGRSRTEAIILGSVVGVVLIAVAIVLIVTRSGSGRSGKTTGTTLAPAPGSTVAPLIPSPTAPTKVTVTVTGGVARISWVPVAPRPGDVYRVVASGPGVLAGFPVDATSSPVTFPGTFAASEHPCFAIYVIRQEHISDSFSQACAAG
jgi:serine/threonine protein kinase